MEEIFPGRRGGTAAAPTDTEDSKLHPAGSRRILRRGNMANQNIRNFSIIAHIDHGKSTIADSILCQKYVLAVPFYRQESAWAKLGFPLSRTNMASSPTCSTTRLPTPPSLWARTRTTLPTGAATRYGSPQNVRANAWAWYLCQGVEVFPDALWIQFCDFVHSL